MDFRILGALEVRDQEGRLLSLGGGRPRTLLAILLMHANQSVAADHLIDLLWPEEPPASVRHSLHLLIHRLRRVLAEHGAADRLRTRNGAYLLEVRPGELDSERLEELLRAGHAELAGGRPAAAAERYEAALALWHGPPLAPFGGSAFARPAAAKLAELHLAAAAGNAEALLAQGRHTEAVPSLEELTRRYPTKERLCQLLMVALYRSGRQADALATFQATRQALVEALGIEPGEELQQLQRALLNRDTSLAAPAAGGLVVAPGTTTTAATPDRPPQPAPAERRVVTVLVVKLKVTRSAREDPEDRWAQYGQTMRKLCEEVERLDGVVHTEIGETLVATFGTRRTRTDDPARAVRAALALRATAASTSATVTVGIDTGQAVVDAGTGRADPPRVTGEVVHSATDLERRAPAGAILVGNVTRTAAAGLTDPRVDFSTTEHLLTVPGEQIWEVVGAEPAAEPADGSPAVVNRERELTLLADLLDRVRTELEPQLVTVIGTPGVGKTRLVAELRARDERLRPAAGRDPDAPGAVWYEGRSLPYGEGVTFWALAEIVKARAGIAATDSAEEAARRLGRSVTAVLGDDRETAHAAEYLQRLVHPQPAADEDAGWLREAFTAWRRYLESLAAGRPLVLVFEDLHWADDAMLDFIEHLADHAHGVPLLIVCLAWPELLDRRPGWSGGKRNAVTTALGPLSAAHTAELLDDLLGEQALATDRREELLTGSGGNPLFVEEYVRMLRERGGPRGQEGSGPRPGVDLAGAIRPPATVELLIGARIDDLDLADRTLLADAAVLGEVFWNGGLTAVSGREEAEVTATLHRLTRREFIRRVRQSSIPGQDEYAFRHLVIRDVAYGRLLRGDRAARHVGAAGWLEGLGGDRAGDLAEVVAHHYQQAAVYLQAPGRPDTELADRAATALRRAGDRAQALAAYPAALRYYDQAHALHPPGRPGWADLVLTREELRLELERRVDVASLTTARSRLESDGDHGSAAVAELVLSAAAFARREPTRAAEHERRARELLQVAPESPASALALNELAGQLGRSNRYAEVMEFGGKALAQARRLGLRRLEAQALCAVGTARVVFGDTAGLGDIRRGIATLEERSSVTVPRAYIQLLGALSHVGDLDGAFEVAAAIHRSAVHFGGQPAVLGYVELGRSLEHYRQGRWDDALASVEAVLGQIQATGSRVPYMEAWCHCVRGKIRRGRGDLAGAMDDSTRAYELAKHADTYVLLPAAGFHGAMLLATGGEKDRASAARIAASVRDRLAGHLITALVGADLPGLLAACGHVPDIDDKIVACSPWLRTMHAFRDGNPEAAADIYAEAGAYVDEALARIRAGERLAGEGRAAEAADQLGRARSFCEKAHATGYLNRIDAAQDAPAPPAGA